MSNKGGHPSQDDSHLQAREPAENRPKSTEHYANVRKSKKHYGKSIDTHWEPTKPAKSAELRTMAHS